MWVEDSTKYANLRHLCILREEYVSLSQENSFLCNEKIPKTVI